MVRAAEFALPASRVFVSPSAGKVTANQKGGAPDRVGRAPARAVSLLRGCSTSVRHRRKNDHDGQDQHGRHEKPEARRRDIIFLFVHWKYSREGRGIDSHASMSRSSSEL